LIEEKEGNLPGSEQVRKEIEKLRAEISHHNLRYYRDDSPEISDEQYDKLYRRLQELEREHQELVTTDSPTQRVGAAPLEKFEKSTHIMAMFSLDNAMDIDGIREFDERVKRTLGSQKEIEYVAEPKIDGLAINLLYEHGVFKKGATRGDGVTGEEVSQNLRTIKELPLRMDGKKPPELIEIRGEVYMKKPEFEKLNKEREKQDESLFANPRNAAAGSVRQLDPKITAERKLHLFAYQQGEHRGITFKTQWEFLQQLKEWGFPVQKRIKPCESIDEVIKVFQSLAEEREKLEYEIDGLVIKVNNLELWKRLGETARAPRWALAAKFAARQETTVVKEIIVGVGRTGALTPVAVLEPVEVGGVTVQRATLHNQDEIDRKDIRIGDTVVVQRAGDVIPEVVRFIPEKRPKHAKKFTLPERCPECGSKVVRPEGEAIHRCVNINCPAQVKERIVHFTTRSAMNIEGLGYKLVEYFFDEGLLKTVSDIYRLKKEELAKLDGLGDKSAQNLVDSIERSKKTTLPRFLYALGIRHIGKTTAQLLAEHFGALEEIERAGSDDFLNIEGIGPELAASLKEFFETRENLKLIKELMDLGIIFQAVKKSGAQTPFTGKTFVLTGGLENMTRDEAKNLISAGGGKVGSSVSKKTDFVVVGAEAGSKLDKAREMGVKTLSENEFTEMLKSAGLL
jgi:DNA ligase (NAD+)